MKHYKIHNFISTTLFAALLSANTYAEVSKDELIKAGSPEEIGEAIAVEFDNRDLGFESQVSKMQMILKNAHGGENRREMEARIFERQPRDIGDKSMLVFFNPRDINGTALVSHANILEADDQWLYLPAVKRVKRISSKNKSGPFVGSEFAYEDITGNEVGKYAWRYDGLEPCPILGTECFKLTSTPKYKHSGYTKRIVWVDTEEFRVDRIDFYDRKDELLKTQTYHSYSEYLDKHWRADSWKMVNHQTGKSTDLLFENYQFKTGLTDKDFDKAALKRVR